MGSPGRLLCKSSGLDGLAGCIASRGILLLRHQSMFSVGEDFFVLRTCLMTFRRESSGLDGVAEDIAPCCESGSFVSPRPLGANNQRDVIVFSPSPRATALLCVSKVLSAFLLCYSLLTIG